MSTDTWLQGAAQAQAQANQQQAVSKQESLSLVQNLLRVVRFLRCKHNLPLIMVLGRHTNEIIIECVVKHMYILTTTIVAERLSYSILAWPLPRAQVPSNDHAKPGEYENSHAGTVVPGNQAHE